jgi:hypothetical protein
MLYGNTQVLVHAKFSVLLKEEVRLDHFIIYMEPLKRNTAGIEQNNHHSYPKTYVPYA